MITKEEIAEIVGPVIWAHSSLCKCDQLTEEVTTEACSKILGAAMTAREYRIKLFMEVLMRENDEAIKYTVNKMMEKLAAAGNVIEKKSEEKKNNE